MNPSDPTIGSIAQTLSTSSAKLKSSKISLGPSELCYGLMIKFLMAMSR